MSRRQHATNSTSRRLNKIVYCISSSQTSLPLASRSAMRPHPDELLGSIAQLSISQATSPTTPNSDISLLPTELLEHVAQYLPLDSFKEFRLSSRNLWLASWRLFAKTYLRELHLTMAAIDNRRIEAVVSHSAHNVWQAAKLTKVMIRVWPRCIDGPDVSYVQQENTRRALCRFPNSVQTLMIIPHRPVPPTTISGLRQRCPYLEILSKALTEGRAKIPSLVIYSDVHPRIDHNAIATRMLSLIGSPGLRWTSNHVQPLEPEPISTVETAAEVMPATSLTIYAHLDQNQVGRPYLGLSLNWLQSLIITSGRMDVDEVLSVLKAHQSTLQKVMLHNIILVMGGWKRLLSFHRGGYPCLTLFEIRNAWERNFTTSMYRHVPANNILFGGREEANAAARDEGEPQEMEEKIRQLKGCMDVLTPLQMLRESVDQLTS